MSFDPTAYARKKQEQRERAARLRAERAAQSKQGTQRSSGQTRAQQQHASGFGANPFSDIPSSHQQAPRSQARYGAHRQPQPQQPQQPQKQNVFASHGAVSPRGVPASRSYQGNANVDTLMQKISGLEQEVQGLRDERSKWQQFADDAMRRLDQLASENEQLQSRMQWLQEMAEKAEQAAEQPSSQPKRRSLSRKRSKSKPKRKEKRPDFNTEMDAPSNFDEQPIGGSSFRDSNQAEEEPAAANPFEEVTIGGSNNDALPDEFAPPPKLKPCPNCGRNFAEAALKRHIKLKVCKKKARKPMEIKRVEAADIDPNIKKQAKKFERMKKKKAKEVPKWKQDRDRLREAIKAGKMMAQAMKDGVDLASLPPPKSSSVPDDRTPCPHCGRKFNADSAARHIPKCGDRNKRRR